MPEVLCLKCGLCCNGVIFARLKLQADDKPARLRQLGLPVAESRGCGGGAKISQPCAAFDGCRCQVYADRPRHCREFECLLLQSVKSGRMDVAGAVKTIGKARRQAQRVRFLLRTLGEEDEAAALSIRFRRTAKRIERMALDEKTAARFGDLTVAMHELNVLLSREFYPVAR